MEDRETPRMRKYGESKTTRIMMATVPHVNSGSGLRKFQADGFLLDRVYMFLTSLAHHQRALQIEKKTTVQYTGVLYAEPTKTLQGRIYVR